MFNTLRSRILRVFGTLVFLTAGAISFFPQRGMETEVSNAGERHAPNLVNTVLLCVENEYRSLIFYREAILERRKAEVKNVVTLAITHLEEDYASFRDGPGAGNVAEDHPALRRPGLGLGDFGRRQHLLCRDGGPATGGGLATRLPPPWTGANPRIGLRAP